MSEERFGDRSYLPSDVGTDVDEDDTGIFPDNAEEDADAMYLLQVKAICVDEPNEASYLSCYVGVILYIWKVFANNEADPIKPAGKGGGIYCPYIAIDARDDWIFKEVDDQNIPLPPTYDEVVDAPKCEIPKREPEG